MREIDNLNDFKNWLKDGVIEKCAIQSIDIKDHESEILNLNFKDSIYLGCKMSNISSGHIAKTGGLVINNREDLSFKAHKSKLYSPEELFKGFNLEDPQGYEKTYDYSIYKEYLETGKENPSSMLVSLYRRLHDHSITDSLEEVIKDRKVVAIMGGHSMERKDPYYLRVAKISRILTQKGFLMISGGGPGAMEATHLGAYFAARSEEELIKAIEEIKIRPVNAPPKKEYKDKDWLHRAWKVMDKYPIPKGKEKESMSIGIPTWLYGHEPPAPFATHIAKYFANSVREDGLLAIAKHGVIFAPGSAGTTQEIFQDAAQNHYAPYNDSNLPKFVSPMILFGIHRWTVERPLWNFLRIAASGRKYSELLYLTESEEDVINKILRYDPEKYTFKK